MFCHKFGAIFWAMFASVLFKIKWCFASLTMTQTKAKTKTKKTLVLSQADKVYSKCSMYHPAQPSNQMSVLFLFTFTICWSKHVMRVSIQVTHSIPSKWKVTWIEMFITFLSFPTFHNLKVGSCNFNQFSKMSGALSEAVLQDLSSLSAYDGNRGETFRADGDVSDHQLATPRLGEHKKTFTFTCLLLSTFTFITHFYGFISWP